MGAVPTAGPTLKPWEFENATLFLRLDPPSKLIRHEDGALFLRLGLPSVLIRHVNGAFRKRRNHYNHVISVPNFSININPK